MKILALLRHSRALWSIYRTALRARPLAASAYVGLIVTDTAAMAVFGFALRELIHAALRHDAHAALIAALVIGIGWAASNFSYVVRIDLTFLLTETVSLELNADVLRMLGTTELSRSEDPEFADGSEVVRRGSDALAGAAWPVLESVAIVARIGVLLAVLAAVSPWLITLIAPLGLVVWLLSRGQQRVRKAMIESAQDDRTTQHLFTVLTDPTAGMELRISGSGTAIRARNRQAWARLISTRAQWQSARLAALGWTVFAAAYTLALLIVLAHSPAADVLFVLTLIATLRAQAENSIWTARRIIEVLHLLDAWIWLREDNAPEPETVAAPHDQLHSGIELRGIGFAYPNATTPALEGIDLRLPAGSSLAIVGEHGAGKTTLVKLLCGLYQPSSGRITIDGTPLTPQARRSWHSRTTATFQDFARFAFTAGESVGVGDLPHLDDPTRLADAIANGDAESVIATLPSGLHTQLGTINGGVDLSRGQWQRIALSRTHCARPPAVRPRRTHGLPRRPQRRPRLPTPTPPRPTPRRHIRNSHSPCLPPLLHRP